ncbi:MAG TPA: glucosaminidase domain-containing protein [Acidimicrobiia bacterium]|nr:glucosaminidase domain-containing protein [Acidimicrobiia bacterium]
MHRFTRRPGRLRRRSLGALLGAVTLGLLAGACGVRAAPPPPPVTFDALTVMGTPHVTATQMVAWFSARTSHASGWKVAEWPPTVALRYIEEGAAEHVAGDVAFVQAVLETGWFRFDDSTVPPSYNNFAGIGATDVNPMPAQFATVQDGIRAQIQHLRAYADTTATTCTSPPLHNPCVDPRFDLVSPKGKAPSWKQFGNGNWATDTDYAAKIWNLYRDLLSYNHVPVE